MAKTWETPQMVQRTGFHSSRVVVYGLLVFFAAVYLFAGRLATRVRALHRQAEAAIDPQGRITGNITPSAAARIASR